ncbi:MAG: CCA tRNA nucleotidyltransferase [Rickettsiaceae bacterium]|nr:MAG: CCA tRNA nucleotidyltransferase [Rickettsiaceae bacterium]
MFSVVNKELKINSNHFLYILNCLKETNHESRLIGGCVRDALINRDNSDIDIATTLTPDVVITKLTSYGIKTIPTGIKFGTVSAFFSAEKFEITTLRKESQYNGRHPLVTFTKSFIEDAKRRDFTINALSYCPFEKKIYDYFGGIEDLYNSKVVFIGEPAERISEDFLRIIRFFRFAFIYDKTISLENLEICKALSYGLKILSHERIRTELEKILICENYYSILQLMYDNNILQLIIPINYFNSTILYRANTFAAKCKIQLSLLTKYALIFYLDNITVHQLISIKFSRQESAIIYDIISCINNFTNYDRKFRFRQLWLEKDNFLQYVIAIVSINKIDDDFAEQFINTIENQCKPIFPINGNDLIKRNINNKEIGRILSLLKIIWIKSDCTLTKQQLYEIMKNIE